MYKEKDFSDSSTVEIVFPKYSIPPIRLSPVSQQPFYTQIQGHIHIPTVVTDNTVKYEIDMVICFPHD